MIAFAFEQVVPVCPACNTLIEKPWDVHVPTEQVFDLRCGNQHCLTPVRARFWRRQSTNA